MDSRRCFDKEIELLPEGDYTYFTVIHNNKSNPDFFIDQGLAQLNGIGIINPYMNSLDTLEDMEDDTIYINVKGEVISSPDLSYDQQQYEIVCNVQELSEMYSKLKDKEYDFQST